MHKLCCDGVTRRELLQVLGSGAAAMLAGKMPAGAAEPSLPPTPAERARRLAELMADDRLFARGQTRVYAGEHLAAISLCLGGIAAGPIQINGRAQRHLWQITKSHRGFSLPESFFAVWVKTADGPAVIRAAQTIEAGPFQPMAAVTFRGEYPFGWYTFEDRHLPVTVSMECFSPLIPLNEKDSSIPCAIFCLTAENTGAKPVEVSFLATQQNAVGAGEKAAKAGGPAADSGGNINRVLHDDRVTLLHMTTDGPKDSPAYGDMALAVLSKNASALAGWESLDSLYRQFAETGRVSGPDVAGPQQGWPGPGGALAVPLRLEPGETQTVRFVLAWHFPNVEAAPGHPGARYAAWWPDALAVARDVAARLDELTGQTRLYHETLYATNLPHWLLDRIGSQVAILSSMTCAWAKDGFFYGWEGCNPAAGCCPGNATHVWGYAQAHARLFPAVGRAMRDADAGSVTPEGMLPVRFSVRFPAFDGQCAFVMSSYREHLLSADRRWLDSRWAIVKRVMDYTIARWNAAGTPSLEEQRRGGIPDGMLRGPQHGMDADQGGTSSWLGSMYLGALAAAARMADVEGDAASAARYRQILAAGSKNQDAALFNGEYYVQIPDPTPREDYLSGCYTDQLLGQWWALQIGCGWLYPPEHVRSAMAALFKYNFHTDFYGFQQTPRKFCDDGDAGMQQCTWPTGGRPYKTHCIRFVDEIMSGFEYSVAGLMIYAGLMKEAFTVLHAAADRYDGRLRILSGTHDSSCGYSGNPFGDDECGKFYSRAMSIWTILLACQGFSYDGPAGTIGFAPAWKPEDHRSLFTAAEGWGLFCQSREGRVQRETIQVRGGKLRLAAMVFELPPGAKATAARVVLGDRAIGHTLRQEGPRVAIRLAEPVVVGTERPLEVQWAWE